MKKSSVVVLSALLIAPAAVAEPKAIPVSVIQLVATPEKFDGKLISVTGFLVMTERALLFLHREDAEHGQASNSFSVIPSQEMRHSQEKLNGMYVRIVGVFHTVPAEGGWVVSQLREIRECYVVSDPARPQELYGKRNPGTRQK